MNVTYFFNNGDENKKEIKESTKYDIIRFDNFEQT